MSHILTCTDGSLYAFGPTGAVQTHFSHRLAAADGMRESAAKAPLRTVSRSA